MGSARSPEGFPALAKLLEPENFLTILMNHELPAQRGAVRAHGTAGAFVSHWTVDLDTLRMVEGHDLTSRAFAYSGGTWVDATGTLVFDRLCSANLAIAGAFFDAPSGSGFDGRLFLNGEEADAEGRAFAHVITGAEYGHSYEVPYLGKFAHETAVAHPNSGARTIVVSPDDSTDGQVYVYVGTKTKSGNPVELAGLHGGRLYGIQVTDGGANYAAGAVPRENAGAVDGTFALIDVTDHALGLGSDLQAASAARGITEFARPEGGFWDTREARSFYWATTGAMINGTRQSARLYRLTFDSIDQPTGGTIDLVVDSADLVGADGAEARGFDNVTVDGAGRVIVQEDAGDDYIGKVWSIDPTTGAATQILESDRNRFAPGAAGFLTVDEENSGVIEITGQVSSASWYDEGQAVLPRRDAGPLSDETPRCSKVASCTCSRHRSSEGGARPGEDFLAAFETADGLRKLASGIAGRRGLRLTGRRLRDSGEALPARLPGGASPVHYDVLIEPDAREMRYRGRETIDIVVRDESRSITLNALDLELSDVSSTDSRPPTSRWTRPHRRRRLHFQAM